MNKEKLLDKLNSIKQPRGYYESAVTACRMLDTVIEALIFIIERLEE